MLLRYIPLFIQSELLKKVGPPALNSLKDAADAIIAQENLTIKVLAAVVVILAGMMAVLAAFGVVGFKLFNLLKTREAQVETAAATAAVDMTRIDLLSQRVEGLVKLLAQAQAMDQEHYSDHEKFILSQLAQAQLRAQELYAEVAQLQRQGREQDREAIMVLSAMKPMLDTFSRQIGTMQETLISSMGMRESNHAEVCSMLNLMLSLMTGEPPRNGLAIAAGLRAMYVLPKTGPSEAVAEDSQTQNEADRS